MRAIIFTLLITLFQLPALAWWHGGHMVVAQIAYVQLSDETQEWVDALAETYKEEYPHNADFIGISTWMDDIRMNGELSAFDSWHYTDLIYDPDGILTPQAETLIRAKHQDRDVIWAIKTASKTLASPKASRYEKALMLAVLVHCTADIHQPLHSCSMYSKRWPGGNLGGNLFKISGEDVSNLHQLWDDSFGAAPRVGLPPNTKDRERVLSASLTLLREYPMSSFVSPLEGDPVSWAKESKRLAIDVAYQLEPGSAPSDEYKAKGRSVCGQRLALAGHRLARLLDKLFRDMEKAEDARGYSTQDSANSGIS